MKTPTFCLIPSLVAVLLTGCDAHHPHVPPTQASTATRVCVDHENKRVDDARCANSPATYSNSGGSYPFGAYYWFYMMGRGSSYPLGGYIAPSYGSYTPFAGANFSGGSSTSGNVGSSGAGAASGTSEGASSSGTTRGGFGSTARGFSGGSSAS